MLPRPRPRPWNSSAVHQFICITFSFFSRKTFKAQHKSVLLFIPRCYVGEALSTAQQSCQLVLGLTANPPEMSSGLEIIREHSHLAEPDIRHILFSTRSLPHFTTCLHSNPRQQDWIQLKAGHGHRSLNILSREVDELQPLSLDKRFHQSTK